MSCRDAAGFLTTALLLLLLLLLPTAIPQEVTATVDFDEVVSFRAAIST
jgi:hypothetical protein